MTNEEIKEVTKIMGKADHGCPVCVGKLLRKLAEYTGRPYCELVGHLPELGKTREALQKRIRRKPE